MIAFRHWLIAGVATPLLVLVAVSITLATAGFLPQESVMEVEIISDVLTIALGFGLGTAISARYIRRQHRIDDPQKIAKLAAIYSAVASAAIIAAMTWMTYTIEQIAREEIQTIGSWLTGTLSQTGAALFTALDLTIAFAVGVFILYVYTKKLLAGNGSSVDQTPPEAD